MGGYDSLHLDKGVKGIELLVLLAIKASWKKIPLWMQISFNLYGQTSQKFYHMIWNKCSARS